MGGGFFEKVVRCVINCNISNNIAQLVYKAYSGGEI